MKKIILILSLSLIWFFVLAIPTGIALAQEVTLPEGTILYQKTAEGVIETSAITAGDLGMMRIEQTSDVEGFGIVYLRSRSQAGLPTPGFYFKLTDLVEVKKEPGFSTGLKFRYPRVEGTEWSDYALQAADHLPVPGYSLIIIFGLLIALSIPVARFLAAEQEVINITVSVQSRDMDKLQWIIKLSVALHKIPVLYLMMKRLSYKDPQKLADTIIEAVQGPISLLMGTYQTDKVNTHTFANDVNFQQAVRVMVNTIMAFTGFMCTNIAVVALEDTSHITETSSETTALIDAANKIVERDPNMPFEAALQSVLRYMLIKQLSGKMGNFLPVMPIDSMGL